MGNPSGTNYENLMVSVRLCGDYKVTVNKVSRLDTYPVPKIEEIHNKLAGGKNIYRARFKSRLRTDGIGRRLERIGNDKYASWFVPLQPFTLWCIICAWNFPKNDWKVYSMEFHTLESSWITL